MNASLEVGYVYMERDIGKSALTGWDAEIYIRNRERMVTPKVVDPH
jgi:hypothetical protein